MDDGVLCSDPTTIRERITYFCESEPRNVCPAMATAASCQWNYYVPKAFKFNNDRHLSRVCVCVRDVAMCVFGGD